MGAVSNIGVGDVLGREGCVGDGISGGTRNYFLGGKGGGIIGPFSICTAYDNDYIS
jgi:hypothetical protein